MANKKKNQSHQLRIIAGKWRGQKIDVIDHQGLRPTTDRIRETLFNWLALPIVNAHCLDVFAGSGVLGFEALSRDAKSVIAIERSEIVCKQIQKNASVLKADAFRLIETEAAEYLITAQDQFDVMFLDPPFAMPELLVIVLSIIIERKLLHHQGLIYLELSKVNLHYLDIFESQINWVKKKSAGQVCYALLSLNT